jgi:hypothetical protein
MRILVPQGLRYTCRYDDRTGDELPVPLGTTAFVSGRTMFDILPRALQSVAVRTRVRYAPHSYVWMAPAAAHSTGLAIESEGKELALSSLPPWTEDKVKVFPMVRAPFEASCPVNLIDFFSLSALADVEEPGDWRAAFPGASLRRPRATDRPAPRGRIARRRTLPR